MFIVHDELWAQAGYKQEDIACRPCFERRLGRPLTLDDYTLCGINFDCVVGFATEERYRLLYAQEGLDYDKTKAQYFERCAHLGTEPNWIV